MATLMHYGIGTLAAASVFLTAATSPRASIAEQADKESSKPAKSLIRIEPITDIWPGRGGVSPGIPQVYRGAAYFAAHNRGDGRDIWCFDGNRTSIAIETNCPAFEYGVRVEVVFKDRLLYTLPGGDQLQLWEFDGATTWQVVR
jgi:hypothetical protein